MNSWAFLGVQRGISCSPHGMWERQPIVVLDFDILRWRPSGCMWSWNKSLRVKERWNVSDACIITYAIIISSCYQNHKHHVSMSYRLLLIHNAFDRTSNVHNIFGPVASLLLLHFTAMHYQFKRTGFHPFATVRKKKKKKIMNRRSIVFLQWQFWIWVLITGKSWGVIHAYLNLTGVLLEIGRPSPTIHLSSSTGLMARRLTGSTLLRP